MTNFSDIEFTNISFLLSRGAEPQSSLIGKLIQDSIAIIGGFPSEFINFFTSNSYTLNIIIRKTIVSNILGNKALITQLSLTQIKALVKTIDQTWYDDDSIKSLFF